MAELISLAQYRPSMSQTAKCPEEPNKTAYKDKYWNSIHGNISRTFQKEQHCFVMF